LRTATEAVFSTSVKTPNEPGLEGDVAQRRPNRDQCLPLVPVRF
jgi:hypothetical protein